MSSSLRNEWREAICASRLHSSAKHVALVLSLYMDPKGACWPAKRTLSEACSLGERTVDVAVLQLEEAGFVRVERSSGRVPNMYYATFPNPAASEGVYPAASEGVRASQPRSNPANDDTPTPRQLRTNQKYEPGTNKLGHEEREREEKRRGRNVETIPLGSQSRPYAFDPSSLPPREPPEVVAKRLKSLRAVVNDDGGAVGSSELRCDGHGSPVERVVAGVTYFSCGCHLVVEATGG